VELRQPDRTISGSTRGTFDVSSSRFFLRRSSALRVSAGLCLLILGAPGCSSSHSGGWFRGRKTTQQWIDQALEAPTPDARRNGVEGLAQSGDAASEWAIKVFDTIARTDSDTMVRCAAVRALGQSPSADRVPLALKLIESGRKKQEDIRPAEGPLRWEAAKMLLEIARTRAYDESQREPIVTVLIDAASKDRDRNVRLTAVAALGCFADRGVPEALIGVMEQEEDFALQHAAEKSLIILTGETHDHDARAWRAWLRSVKDPFERAGQTPEQLRPENRPKQKWRWEWEL